MEVTGIRWRAGILHLWQKGWCETELRRCWLTMLFVLQLTLMRLFVNHVPRQPRLIAIQRTLAEIRSGSRFPDILPVVIWQECYWAQIGEKTMVYLQIWSRDFCLSADFLTLNHFRFPGSSQYCCWLQDKFSAKVLYSLNHCRLHML